MTEAFLLGSWLGGALCYGAVLSRGDKQLPLLTLVGSCLAWPLSLALVYAAEDKP